MSDGNGKIDAYSSPGMTELKYAGQLRLYEQIKLALMVIVLLIDIFIGLYLIGIAKTNSQTLTGTKQGLVILQCAVNKSTYQDPAGKPLTQAESRTAFQACVAAGGPKIGVK